jgi:hypothetical protein
MSLQSELWLSHAALIFVRVANGGVTRGFSLEADFEACCKTDHYVSFCGPKLGSSWSFFAFVEFTDGQC